ncbi:toll/interleukin-1 receptor domain-containing protein [Amycolatopsis japonica]|uniref:toll/interleukin-1 receptor domain-containing protein n=1 Tax=Amycolatopsis japonica TaxID=208439 RepID=UPI00333304B6
MSETSGFWSYVHKDDEAEGERISQLARDVVAQFEMISGEGISLFLDQDSIEWGDEWRPKVDAALASIAFFVPILTPRYFQSKECRRELNFFARRAKDLGVSELIMPIKYIDFPALSEDDPMDDAIILARSFQWEDWTELRFSSRTSPEYRQAIAKMADRIHRAYLSTEKTEIEPDRTDSHDDDDTLGSVEIIAKAEQSFPAWTSTLEQLGEAITAIGTLMQKAADENQSSTNSTYGARLVMINRVARELEEPTTRVESLANEYSKQLHAVDDGLSLIFQMIPSEIKNKTSSPGEVYSFTKSITDLASSASESLDFLETFIETLGPVERTARTIRPVVRRLRKSLTLLLEARELTQNWVAQIDDLNLPLELLGEDG